MISLYSSTTSIRKPVNLLFIFIAILFTYSSKAQCPVNIDFEDGTFNGWTCYTGSVTTSGTRNVINLSPSAGPIAGRHQMLSSVPGDGVDEYGFFPKNCPNGSGHSIKLGNNLGGAQAEGVSYTFTIPANQNKFSLIYYYAVVFQDPGHLAYQQPRLEIDITNVTDGTQVGCSSFSFIATSGLPGFFQSTNPMGNTPVWCKDWSATSINLDGNAGKTIRLFFKTADCTFSAHFGYAYIDVNTECSSSFVGATFCSDDTAINVRAPYGYQSYTWYNSNFSQVLGNQQVLHLSPPPPAGSTVAVELVPFAGYGCRDTLYAQLLDTLTVQANAGPDKISCNSTPVQLGGPPRQGLVYSWSPTLGLSNPYISNPLAAPTTPTNYILHVTHDGGGCPSWDTVFVNAATINDTITVIGATSQCTGNGQNTILQVHPTDSIQWFKDNVAISGANQTQYTVTQTGSYYAALFSFTGCRKNTLIQQITIYAKPVAGFTINNTSQCFSGNQFNFTNSSTTTFGGLTFVWNFGDGNTATTIDANHSYSAPGNYIVKLLVTGDGGCQDSLSYNVTVNTGPLAGFNINDSVQCFKNHQFIFTNTSSITSGTLQYNWDAGDGTTFTTRDLNHSYTTEGTYIVKLIVTGSDGCKDSSIHTVIVNPSPVAAFNANNIIQCFASNQFTFTNASTVGSGTLQYSWDLGNGTTLNTQDVTYSYPQPGNYIVKLFVTGAGGCVDSASTNITVNASPKASFTVNNLTQCFKNNSFAFTNTSTLSSGTLQYNWDLGDGTVFTSRDITHAYLQTGTYHVKLTVTNTTGGCQDTASYDINVNPSPVAGFTVNTANQCFLVNQYSFLNTSTVSAGSLQYIWSLGDGSIQSTQDVTYNYPQPGNYTVKLIAATTDGCIDSSSLPVVIYPNPTADFSVKPVCINLDVPVINKTINNTTSVVNYLWDFGDGQTSSLQNPKNQYLAPGTYTITLTVSTTQCPTSTSSKQADVIVDIPAPGITYSQKDAVINFPLQLQARTFGNSVLWSPQVSLNEPFSRNPIFTGPDPVLYTIQIKTVSGCVTIDTQFVKTFKKIEIYVPSGFTPNGDGVNDYLRPILMGFKKLNYFKVYNRWGSLLFSTNNETPGWNGKAGNEPLSSQAVVWIIEAVDVDGVTHKKQGTSVIIR